MDAEVTEFFLTILLVFVSVFLFTAGMISLWQAYKSPEAIRLKKRLDSISESWTDADKAQLIKYRALSESRALDNQLRKIPIFPKLDQFILQSGLDIKVSKVLYSMILLCVAGFVISYLTQSVFGFVLSIFVASMPLLYIGYKRGKRILKMEEQLPDIIDLMARALRAGHAFSGALQMASDEGPEPLAKEFRITFDEINYGISLSDALMHLSLRVPISDLRFFVIAILIQRESGGNLAELLESISNLIRARLKLLGTIRVLSAEGRLSAWILGCLPFGLGLILQIINPGYLDILFTDPSGGFLIGGTLTMMLIGAFVMSKIIKIRV